MCVTTSVTVRGFDRDTRAPRLGVALNRSRRSIVGQLVARVASLGVEAIAGKPYKPTTQGKNRTGRSTRRPCQS